MHLPLNCAIFWTTLHWVITLFVHCQHVRVSQEMLNQNRLRDQNLIIGRLLNDHSGVEAGQPSRHRISVRQLQKQKCISSHARVVEGRTNWKRSIQAERRGRGKQQNAARRHHQQDAFNLGRSSLGQFLQCSSCIVIETENGGNNPALLCWTILQFLLSWCRQRVPPEKTFIVKRRKRHCRDLMA